jgi:hypothetical protein
MKELFKELKDELESIKKLLAIHLINSDVEKKEIANALGITAGRLTQIVPFKKKTK